MLADSGGTVADVHVRIKGVLAGSRVGDSAKATSEPANVAIRVDSPESVISADLEIAGESSAVCMRSESTTISSATQSS